MMSKRSSFLAMVLLFSRSSTALMQPSLRPYSSTLIRLWAMKDLPPDLVKYNQVPKDGVFTAKIVPKGLLKEHSTKAGTWGVIKVTKGRLGYRIVTDEEPIILDPEKSGVIEPQILHGVSVLTDDVEFVVEFHRVAGTGPVNEKREGLTE